MASISFHPQFINDLVTGDSQLSNRVLKKIFTDTGDFRRDKDDHAYHGIENAWIRVVSRGRTAFRVIYIRKGDRITLYRAGPHSVEDDLASPTLVETVPIAKEEIIERGMRPIGLPAAISEMESSKQAESFNSVLGLKEFVGGELSRFMKNHESRRLYQQIVGRRLLPHKEAFLVSPFLSLDLLEPTENFGGMLDRWIEDGCSVSLITKPPTARDLPYFNQLEARGFSIIYVEKLHAKAYVFRLDREKLSRWETVQRDLMVVGSANMTNSGLNPPGERYGQPQLELSYEIGEKDYEELESFVTYLAAVGTSHEVFRKKLAH